MRQGVIETEHISMKCQSMDRVIAVSIFNVTTNRMVHIGSMNTDLIFSASFQFKFNKRVVGRTIQHMKM